MGGERITEKVLQALDEVYRMAPHELPRILNAATVRPLPGPLAMAKPPAFCSRQLHGTSAWALARLCNTTSHLAPALP